MLIAVNCQPTNHIVYYLMMCTYRKSIGCYPNLVETTTDDERLPADHVSPQVTLNKTKNGRKSRRLRRLKAASCNCKQTSVAVQTENANPKWTSALRPTFVTKTVSTQTDDVVVISVSRQLHSLSEVPNGLLRSGHSSLLPAIRRSDVHDGFLDSQSAHYHRDTDSGHMSDTENRALEAVQSASVDTYTQPHMLSTSSMRNGRQLVTTSHDYCQQSQTTSVASKYSESTSEKFSSDKADQLLRWSTNMRLDRLDEDDAEETPRPARTFFASLETLDNHETSQANDVNVSGISSLGKPAKSNLRSVFSPAGLLADHARLCAGSSSSSGSLTAGGTRLLPKVSDQSYKPNLPTVSGSVMPQPLPSTPGSRVSSGSRQSGSGKPRVSVGRKSLTKRRSVSMARCRHVPATAVSRPAAWLIPSKTSHTKVHRTLSICTGNVKDAV